MPSAALDALLAKSQGWGVKKRPPIQPDQYLEPFRPGVPDHAETLAKEATALGIDIDRLIGEFGKSPATPLPPKPPTVDDLYSGEQPPVPSTPASLGPHGIFGPRPLPIPQPPEEPEAPYTYPAESVGRPEAQPRKPTFMEQLNESPIGDATLMPIRDRAIEALPQSIRTLYETAKAKAGELIEPIKRIGGYPLRAFGNIKDMAVELPIALGEAISGQPLPGHAHEPGAGLDEILAADEAQRQRNLSGEGESVPLQSVGFLEAALGRNPAEQFRASGPLDRLIAQMTGAPVPKAGEMVQTPAIERILKNAGLQTADTALGMASDPGIALTLGAGAGGGIGRKTLDLMFQYEGAKGLAQGVGAAATPTPEGVDPREASIEKMSDLGGAIGSAGVFFGPSVVPAVRGKAAQLGALREGKQQAITEGVQEAFGKEVSQPRQSEIEKLFAEADEAPTSTSGYVRPSVRQLAAEATAKLTSETPTPPPPKPEGWERKSWSPENAEPMPPGAAKFMAREEIAAAAAAKKKADVAAASLANEGKRAPKPPDPRQLALLEELKTLKTQASLAGDYGRVKTLTQEIEAIAGEQPIFPEAEPVTPEKGLVFDAATQPGGGPEIQLPLPKEAPPGPEPPPPVEPGAPTPRPPVPPAPPAAPENIVDLRKEAWTEKPAAPQAPAARPTSIEEMLNGPVTPTRPAPPPTAIVPETRVAKGIVQPGLPVVEETAPVQRRYKPPEPPAEPTAVAPVEPVPPPPAPPAAEAKPQTIDDLIGQLTGGKPEPKVEVVEPGGIQANAGGESAASVEAMNRQLAMAAQGKRFVMVDPGGNVRPLIGADAVDIRPGRGEAKAIQNADGTYELVEGDAGAVGRVKPPAPPPAAVEPPKPADLDTLLAKPGKPGTEPPVAPAAPAAVVTPERAADSVQTQTRPGLAPDVSADPILQNGKLAKDPNAFVVTDPTVLNLAPELYQHKKSGKGGVTGTLAGITEWEAFSPPLLVHEQANGKLYVANGHQRYNRYMELRAEGKELPPLRVRIMREADGVDVPTIRRMAAEQNIVEGTATPMDVAKLLREAPLTAKQRGKIAKGERSGLILTTAEGLKGLSQEAFLTIDDIGANPHAVATVAKYFTDPKKQIGAIQAITKKGIDNYLDGEAYARKLASNLVARGEKAAQGDLFGNAEFEDITYVESQLERSFGKTLASRLSAVKNALKNKTFLEESGTATVNEGGASIKTDLSGLKNLYTKYKDMAGSATNNAIRKMAGELYAKRVTDQAAADYISDALRRDIDTGGYGDGKPAEGSAVQPGPGGRGDGQPRIADEAVPPAEAEPTATVAEAEKILQQGAKALNQEAPPLADKPPLTLVTDKATEGMPPPTKAELEAAGQTDMFAEPAKPEPPKAPAKPATIDEAITGEAPVTRRTYRQAPAEEYARMVRARNEAADAAAQRGPAFSKRIEDVKPDAEKAYEQGGVEAVEKFWQDVKAKIETKPATVEGWTSWERIADNAEIVAPAAKDFVAIRFEGQPDAAVREALKEAGFNYRPNVGHWIGNVEGPTNRRGRPREELVADAKRIIAGEPVRDTPTTPTPSTPSAPSAGIPSTASSTSSPVPPPIEAPKAETKPAEPQAAPTIEKIAEKKSLDTPEEQTVIGNEVQKAVDKAIEKIEPEPPAKPELDTMLEPPKGVYDELPPNVRSYLLKQAGLTREDINNFTSVEEARDYGKRYGENERAKAEAAKAENARAAAGQPKKLTPVEDLAGYSGPLEPKVEQWVKLIEKKLKGEPIVDEGEYSDFVADQANRIARAKAIRDEIAAIEKDRAKPLGEESKLGPIASPNLVEEAIELADRFKAQASEGAVVEPREMMRQAREREALLASGSPLALRRYGEMLAKVYARLAEKGERGGTATKKVEAEIPRTEGGELIGSGFGALQGMITLAKKNPTEFKRIMVSAGIGGAAGATIDEEDRWRGMMLGLAAGATAAIVAPANAAQLAKLQAAAKKLRLYGKEPGETALRREPRADRDLNLFEVLLPLNPESVVPEAYRKATKIMDDLNNEMAYGKLAGEDRAIQKSVAGDYVKEAVRTLRELSKEATDAGLTKKGIYINRMADALSKRPTKGQMSSMEFAKATGLDKLVEKAGGKLGYDYIERATGITAYRVLTGYALDTALQNLTQPILAMRHVGVGDLLWAYKMSRTQWAKDQTKHIHVIRPTDLEETSPGVAATKGASEASTATDWLTDSQRLIAKSDNFNRRVVYLAAMRAAERNGLMGSYAREWARAAENQTFTEAYRTEADGWARQVMRDTQGDIGPLAVNPLYRGPVGGSIRPFTKFPTLLFRNLLDAAFQPDATGRNRFFMATATAVLLGKQLGFDLEDTLLMGGRPFGIDITNPREALKKITSLDVFPVVKGAADVWKHIQGTANHPILPTSLDDFFNSDLAYVGLTRYPTKVGAFVKRTLEEGAGDRVTRTPSGAVKELTALEDFMGLTGFKATRPNQLAKVTSDASGELYQGEADRKAKAKEIVRQIRVAHDAHDPKAVAKLQQELAQTTRSSKAVINAMQGIDRTQWERILRQASPRVRAQLVEKYGELIEGYAIGK